MSTRNNSAASRATAQEDRWDAMLDDDKRPFRVQSTPPLSLRQFVRSTITTTHGDGPWKPPGIGYVAAAKKKSSAKSRGSSPAVLTEWNEDVNPLPRSSDRKKPTHMTTDFRLRSPVETTGAKKPPWRPTGPNLYIPSDSSDDEKTPEPRLALSRPETPLKTTKKIEKPWRPSGFKKYPPVRYFDPPSLRWTLRDIKRSMSEFNT